MSFISKLFGFNKKDTKKVAENNNKKDNKTEDYNWEDNKAEDNDKLETSSHKDFPGTEDEYFAYLMNPQNFDGFTIETNVHVNRFDSSAHPACYPVSYLFLKDSVPVLAVFVMQTNQYRSMIARGSYTVLEDNDIPYIRFFKGFANQEEYVLERVRNALKGQI